jgi:hypothetical protein
MMPVAVFLMFGELWLMEKVIVPDARPESRQAVVSKRANISASPENLGKRVEAR